jgi:hypothetical protein
MAVLLPVMVRLDASKEVPAATIKAIHMAEIAT